MSNNKLAAILAATAAFLIAASGIFKSASSAGGPSAQTALNAALIARESGRWKEALSILETATDAWEDSDPRLRSELAWAYLNAGFFDKARDILSSKSAPDQEEVFTSLVRAWVELELGKNTEAGTRLSALAERKPKLTLIPYLQGKLSESEGKTEEAIDYYQNVIQMDSHFIEVRPFLASLFEKKKDVDQAWKQYARLSAADSSNTSARSGMRRLGGSITKTPEEILSPKTIPGHTSLPAFAIKGKSSVIKVGIGSTSGGNPSRKDSVAFRTSVPFSFVDPDNGRDLLSGEATAVWKISLASNNQKAEIFDSNGKVRGKFRESLYIRLDSTGSATTILNSLNFAPDTSWGGMVDKEVRGLLEMRVNKRRGTLVAINHVSLEEYLYGVLAAEMPVHWPLEALKTQAVIARTQATYRKGLHRKYGYDVCDEQHCQVYTGVSVESQKVWTAVDETRGEIITYQWRPAHTVFSSNCGGKTQSGRDAGWGEVAYWRPVFDGSPALPKPHTPFELKEWLMTTPAVYCRASTYTWDPEFRWTRLVEAADIAKKLSGKKKIGRIEKIQILKRNQSGRVQKVKITGTTGWIMLEKEHEIRKYLGLGSLRSTLFVMEPVYREDRLAQVIFIGGGWGHGVGLCQSGAAGRAEAGFTYREILKQYFPGVDFSTR